MVAAELCRRNVFATPFAGNVPRYDMIASGPSAGHVPIQVKASNGPNWQFDFRKFAGLKLAQNGEQIIGERHAEPVPNLMYVLVLISELGQDRFFILEWKQLQDVVVRHHEAYLSKHGGIRPRKSDSPHVAIGIDEVKEFENHWDNILKRATSG